MNKALCYITSAYNTEDGYYSFAGIIRYEGKRYIITKVSNDKILAPMKNVGAEIHGATEVIKECIKLGIKRIDLYSYLQFIGDILNGTKKSKKPGVVNFLTFIRNNKQNITINFIKAYKKDDIFSMKESKFICKYMLHK